MGCRFFGLSVKTIACMGFIKHFKNIIYKSFLSLFLSVCISNKWVY